MRWLLAEFPGGAVFGVLDFEAEGLEFVAYFVAGGPVFVGLGLAAYLEQEVDGVAEGGFALAAAALLGAQAEDVAEEGVEDAAQGIEAFGGDGGLAVGELVDGVAGFEEVADDDGRVEVVVHGVVALLLEGGGIVGREGAARGGLHAVELGKAVDEALQTFAAGFEGFVGEVDGGAVVGLEDEEADGHGGVGFVEVGVLSGEEFLEGDEVAQALAHFLSVDGNHVVVHPVVDHVVALGSDGLCYFAFVVGEDEVHAAAVDVEVVAEVFASHGGALAVPAGEAVAPGRGPAHDVLRLGLFPEGEIDLVVFLAHAAEFAAGVDDVFEVAVGEAAVAVVTVIFLDVEIDAAV